MLLHFGAMDLLITVPVIADVLFCPGPCWALWIEYI